MPTISFIGDVHCRYPEYLEMIRDCEYSIQLGDMGFRYDKLGEIDAKKHRFVPGNHDNYEDLFRRTHSGWRFSVEGDYGILSLAGTEIMYVRGGYSIDKMFRREGVNWFADEEIESSRLARMVEEMSRLNPRIVVSHECPGFVAEEVINANLFLLTKFRRYHPSRTAVALEELHTKFAVPPDLWVFGHHHVEFDQTLRGTRFVCVPELARFDIDADDFKADRAGTENSV